MLLWATLLTEERKGDRSMGKKCIRVFFLAVLAGLAISIGGCIFLVTENKILGALFFTVGLYIIVLNGLFLYTGKIGYLATVEDKIGYISVLLFTWLGNLAGTWLGAMGMQCSKLSFLSEVAAQVSAAKLEQSVISALILAIFCGVLMFVAVDGFKETKNPLILFLCVSVFILCGFEHCIANMFYFSMGHAWSGKAFGYILLMTLGNSIGGMLIPQVKRMADKYVA